MSAFKFCRICLDSSNVRMHQISGSEVQDVYEKLTKNKIQDDGKLYFACYICYCQLKNSQQLVIKSQKSEELLKQISGTTPELNMQAIPVLGRLLSGLQNSLILSDIVTLQIPDFNNYIKTEDQADTDEIWNTSEPGYGGAPPNKMLKLDEKYNLCQFQTVSIEFEDPKNISETQTETVDNKNKSSHLLYDGNNKQVIVKNNKITESDNLNIEFKCQYCNYISVRRDMIEDHIRTHTGEKPFKCQDCSYTCKDNNSLRKHIRTHTGEKPLKCQYCSYTCARNSDLKNHTRTHTGEKPFKCQYCSYTCIQNISLKRHIRTHTGEKPFKCQFCSYTCIDNSALKKHIKTHTGEKPYKCQYCSYTCIQNSTLKKHTRIHTEDMHTCEICDKQFRSRSKFEEHLRVHPDYKSC